MVPCACDQRAAGALHQFHLHFWGGIRAAHDLFVIEERLQACKNESVRTMPTAETELWGGTPFAHHVSLSEEHLEAWNASAHNQPSLEWLHKTVCVAYYLPEKYQVGPEEY